MPFGAAWGSKGPAWEVLYHLGDGSGDIFAQLWCAWGDFWTEFREKLQFLDFSTTLKRDWWFWGFEGTKLEPSGLQGAVLRRSVRAKWPRTGPAERSGQQKGGKVWPVGSVLLSELWKRPGNGRKRLDRLPELSQVGGESLSKRQVI